ncbi:FecR family protein [Chitinophaga flava]|uniref:Iron dicitrate transport regulator FecR n=1 Tax=Chitinophaga flava TaxID=2259036 RepID=A0A365XU77_9BACT|nr:FecR domain-containing protein [Chitinophaga flava]RBL89571.1 iron dicitrate transport regulator FecR [Chitinophaga flava]
MSDQLFETLFKDYMSGTLSASELQQFRQMARDRKNRQLLSRLLEEAFSNPAYAEAADYDASEMAAEILLKARQQDEVLSLLPPTRKPPVFRPWFKYAAAAALFGCLVAGTWKFAGRRHPARQTLATNQPAIPGKAQPVLILGDGSKISLDNVSNGTIAQQGGSRIVKLSNGQVAYQPASAPTGRTIYNTMQTPHGCMYQLTLPDGSRVWLNAASSIRYPTTFPANSRQVAVTGEAYFDIAKDEHKPFTVTANDIQIQVLGTAFNIMAYPDENTLQATLVQGAININTSKTRQLLQPGEQASIGHTSGQLSISRPNLDEVLSWKNGEFYFRDTNIKTIMRQVARWYNVEVQYEGDMTDLSLSGIISRNGDIQQLLKALELTKIVRFRMKDRIIFVSQG